MNTHLVNLDALIQREDFESVSEVEGAMTKAPLFKVEELKHGKLYFNVLRKPDFQRETASWKPEMIADFVESFLDGKVIPSVIFWHSPRTGKLFIIDGAHRISALISWVNDDYGNGIISKKFFVNSIPEAQKRLHTATRELIERRVGTFQSLLDIGLDPELTDDVVKQRRARAIATRQLDLQTVQGDAAVAEESFFKINGNPATIDPTELDIIRARKKPNAIATRALMRAGTGHKYWAFPVNGPEIEETAKEVYHLIFGPIVEIMAQCPDVPRAGQPYSEDAFKMMLDMVNLFNGITDPMWEQSERRRLRKGKSPIVRELDDDNDGSETLKLLKRLKEVGRLAFSSEYSGSLGLDPAVYAYGATGKLHHAAFLAALKFAVELQEKKQLYAFTTVRAEFEEFLVKHKSFLNDLSHSRGSRTRALEPIMLMHRTVFECLKKGVKSDEAIVKSLTENASLKGLKMPAQIDPEVDIESGKRSRRFSKTAQAIVLVNDVLESRSKCPVCHARLPPNARSRDHIINYSDGGTSNSDNLQYTHPYCNSGYKESRRQNEKSSN